MYEILSKYHSLCLLKVDKSNKINRAKFMQNGSCGYILKPNQDNDFMAQAGYNFTLKFYSFFLEFSFKDKADIWELFSKWEPIRN